MNRPLLPPFSEYGTIYLALPECDDDHLIYKLHSVRDTKRSYRWMALWNTCAHTSPFRADLGRRPTDHKTIVAAIGWIERNRTYRVVEMSFNELVGKRQLDRMYRVAGIDRRKGCQPPDLQ